MAAAPNGGAPGLWGAATQLGIETWEARGVKDPALADRIRNLNVDLLLNVHSLYLIRPEVVAAPRIGSYNLHPGPLPRYAGLNTVSWAIYRGEPTHGVTVHRMEAGIDTGDIAYQTLFPIGPEESALAVYSRCIRDGVAMLERLVDDAGGQGIPRIPQDSSQREYFGRGVPQDGRVDWNRPAAEVARFVRACDYFPFPSPWGHPQAQCGGISFGLARVAEGGPVAEDTPPGVVGTGGEHELAIAAADRWVLCRKVVLDGSVRPATGLLRPGDRCELL